MYQPIEEKWKEKVRNDFNGILSEEQIEETISYWENLLEQERKKLVKRIDSFPLSDSMFFDENNWKAGYKALEEFKQSIINN